MQEYEIKIEFELIHHLDGIIIEDINLDESGDYFLVKKKFEKDQT